MAGEVSKEAHGYIDRSIATQARLGYAGEVPQAVYDRALTEIERATDRLRKASRRGPA